MQVGIFDNRLQLETIYRLNPCLKTFVNLSRVSKAGYQAIIGNDYFRLRMLIANIYHRAIQYAEAYEGDSICGIFDHIEVKLLITMNDLEDSDLLPLLQKLYKVHLWHEFQGILNEESLEHYKRVNPEDRLDIIEKNLAHLPINTNNIFFKLLYITNFPKAVQLMRHTGTVIIENVLLSHAQINLSEALFAATELIPKNITLAREFICINLNETREYIVNTENLLLLADVAVASLPNNAEPFLNLLKNLRKTNADDVLFYIVDICGQMNIGYALKAVEMIKEKELRFRAYKVLICRFLELDLYISAFKCAMSCEADDRDEALLNIIVCQCDTSLNGAYHTAGFVQGKHMRSIALFLIGMHYCQSRNYSLGLRIIQEIPSKKRRLCALSEFFGEWGKVNFEEANQAASLLEEKPKDLQTLLALNYPLERCKEVIPMILALSELWNKDNIWFNYIEDISEKDIKLAFECTLLLPPSHDRNKMLQKLAIKAASINIEAAAITSSSDESTIAAILEHPIIILRNIYDAHERDRTLLFIWQKIGDLNHIASKYVLSLIQDKNVYEKAILELCQKEACKSNPNAVRLLRIFYPNCSIYQENMLYIYSIPLVVKKSVKQAIEFAHKITSENKIRQLADIAASCSNENLPNIETFRHITVTLLPPTDSIKPKSLTSHLYAISHYIWG